MHILLIFIFELFPTLYTQYLSLYLIAKDYLLLAKNSLHVRQGKMHMRVKENWLHCKLYLNIILCYKQVRDNQQGQNTGYPVFPFRDTVFHDTLLHFEGRSLLPAPLHAHSLHLTTVVI